VGFTVTADSQKVCTLSISYEEILACAADSLARRQMAKSMAMSMQAYFLRQVPPLQNVSEHDFQAVLRQTQEVFVPAWEILVAKGNPLQACYILEEGHVLEHPCAPEDLQYLQELEIDCPEHSMPGAYFGERCFLEKEVLATRTLVAATDCRVLLVPQLAVWELLQEEVAQIMQVPFFRAEFLCEDDRFALARAMKPWRFGDGQAIVSEGDVEDRLYIVKSGICLTYARTGNGSSGRGNARGGSEESIIGRLIRGACIDDMAVLEDLPRTCTVRATGEVDAMSLSRADIIGSLGRHKFDRLRSFAAQLRVSAAEAAREAGLGSD